MTFKIGEEVVMKKDNTSVHAMVTGYRTELVQEENFKEDWLREIYRIKLAKDGTEEIEITDDNLVSLDYFMCSLVYDGFYNKFEKSFSITDSLGSGFGIFPKSKKLDSMFNHLFG
tara:strand:+ start:677 stop:1021 length:345 start_codon:yes stop_codon:yes gene_type:complete